MITIFTPTYNRAYKLESLFNSLQKQTIHDFEWVIVDDGSTDNTKNLIEKFKRTAKFKIIYKYQKNSGKHIAINRGASLSSMPLFFIVDSDDQLYDNSIKIIKNNYKKIKKNKKIAGIGTLKTYFNGEVIGGEVDYDELITSYLDYRYKLGYKGDKAEVFKTEIIKKYPFPETENEKFCPEALIWNRIGNEYSFLFVNEKTYKCEYLPDGLTNKIFKIRAKSPYNSMITYSELTKYKIPFTPKLKASINFWRFAFYYKKNSFLDKFKMINYFFSIFGLLPGYIMYKIEKNKIL